MSGENKNELAATFSPAEIEAPLYKKWQSAGYFKADANSKKPPFTIVIPPPNVTGSLHIGHALDHTIQDLLIRMKRMKGFEALWLPGMDHAGIATQNVVEKQLAAEGKSRHDLGRDAFVEKVWQWKAESGGAILDQMKRLGDSVDWDREAFTMDANLSKAVLTIFKQLFDQDLIYRAERIINWCPRCLTALSDIQYEAENVIVTDDKRSNIVDVLSDIKTISDGFDTYSGLLLMTDVPGVNDKSGNLISQLSTKQALDLIDDGTITGGMIPKIKTCISAIESGVNGVVIIDGRKSHAVLFELFSNLGAGTLIIK